MSDHDRALERAAEALWDDWRRELPYLPDGVTARLEADWSRRQARVALAAYLDSLLEGLPAQAMHAFDAVFYETHPQDAIRPLEPALAAFLRSLRTGLGKESDG